MSQPLPAPDTSSATVPAEDDATLAQALIAEERANLRTGFGVLAVFFGLVAVGAFLFSFFVVHKAQAFVSVPVLIAIALILFSLGRRMLRLTRSLRRMQRNWDAGKLGNGDSALTTAHNLRAQDTNAPM